MARETWRDYYGKMIDVARNEAIAAGLDGKELRKYVREMTRPGTGPAGRWGLKMWQQEFRVRVRGLPRRKRSSTPAIADLPGQRLLFED